jgi:ribosomal protein L37E
MKGASLRCGRCGQNGLVNSYDGVVCVNCGYHPPEYKSKHEIDPKIIQYFDIYERQAQTQLNQATTTPH